MATRFQTLFERLQRLIPPPDATGWHLARLNLEAAAMGEPSFTESTQDEQAAASEAQLYLGAKLQRVDSNAGNWDTSKAVSWRLQPVLDAGSSGFFLDVWGRTLAVPRLDGEADSNYAKRIVAEVSRSTTTNQGLADAIDAALNTTGTQVLDASDVLTEIRFNSGKRMNNGLRMNNAGVTKSLWCCFVIKTPVDIALADMPKFEELVNRRKAAGTRLIGIVPTPSV